MIHSLNFSFLVIFKVTFLHQQDDTFWEDTDFCTSNRDAEDLAGSDNPLIVSALYIPLITFFICLTYTHFYHRYN